MAVTQYWGEWSWGKSLLLKSAILGMGIAVVLWAGWPQPHLRHDDRAPLPPVLHQSNKIQESSYSSRQSVGAATLDPSELPGEEGKEESLSAASTTLLVDLNLGSRMELELLPGIGMTLADRIVSYRSLHGNFKHVQDLGKVAGIGEKRLKQLEPFVTVQTRVGKRTS